MEDKNKNLTTSYESPDLDGFACSYAYNEFLNKAGKNSVVAIFGEPHREAQFVLDRLNNPFFQNAENIVGNFDNIVLLDVSVLDSVPEQISSENITEVIDHRKMHEADKFPNAKVQIELVGSAATLIGEKFYENNIDISEESATLLFSAIVSNTIYFQANVTTERDYKIANRLQTKCVLSENYVHDMFTYKSKFNQSLREIIVSDFDVLCLNGYNIGIGQLEIINVDDFVEKNLYELKKILEQLKIEESLDFVFLTCLDLEEAFNKFLLIDEKTKQLMEQMLNVVFENGCAKRKGILMRKEIVPLIKDILENKKL